MVDATSSGQFVVFAGGVRVASGDLAQVAVAACGSLKTRPEVGLLVFSRETGEVVDLDLRGGEEAVAARYARPDASAARRGRPKLGIVAREVTLLPRHWDWLARQPGGASTTLRRLVEAARGADSERARMRAEGTYRFMSAIAGDLAGFEEATRALFAGDRARLTALISAWPPDISDEVLRFAAMPG